jgi:hypothetical protein
MVVQFLFIKGSFTIFAGNSLPLMKKFTSEPSAAYAEST